MYEQAIEALRELKNELVKNNTTWDEKRQYQIFALNFVIEKVSKNMYKFKEIKNSPIHRPRF